MGRIRALFAGCGFVRLADVQATQAAEWLTRLRNEGEAPAVPQGVKEFSPGVAAVVLGVSREAVRTAVKRHGLEATGNGKAKRLPRATVETLAFRMGRGASPQTVNHYVRAVRGFFRWMVLAKRIGSNPLDTLSLLNAHTDIRRGRRELTADELKRVLTATRASTRSYRGLFGEDRFHLYLTAATTGFRANALANLTPANFDLSAESPTVALAVRFNSKRPVIERLAWDGTVEVFLREDSTHGPFPT